MLLATQCDLAGQAVGGGGEGGFGVAPAHIDRRQHPRRCLGGGFGAEDGRQRVDVYRCQAGRAAGLLVAVGGDGEEWLTVEHHQAVGENRVVVLHRATVVYAGNVGRHDDCAHAGGRTHGRQVDGADASVGHVRQAQRGVQGAGGFRQVVGIAGRAGDVQVGALVGQAGADARGRAAVGGVHGRVSTSARRTGMPDAALFSSHRRRSRLAVTWRR